MKPRHAVQLSATVWLVLKKLLLHEITHTLTHTPVSSRAPDCDEAMKEGRYRQMEERKWDGRYVSARLRSPWAYVNRFVWGRKTHTDHIHRQRNMRGSVRWEVRKEWKLLREVVKCRDRFGKQMKEKEGGKKERNGGYLEKSPPVFQCGRRTRKQENVTKYGKADWLGSKQAGREPAS